MNKQRFFSWIAVTILWFGLGAGCKKDPPAPQSCNDGTCCMESKSAYEYIETIENAPADLAGPPRFSRYALILKEPVPRVKDPRWGNVDGPGLATSSVQVCDLTVPKVESLEQTQPLKVSDPYPHRYRVWGKVYYDVEAQPITSTPIIHVYIDRIEKVN